MRERRNCGSWITTEDVRSLGAPAGRRAGSHCIHLADSDAAEEALIDKWRLEKPYKMMIYDNKCLCLQYHWRLC